MVTSLKNQSLFFLSRQETIDIAKVVEMDLIITTNQSKISKYVTTDHDSYLLEG